MLAEMGHIVLTDFGSAKLLKVSQKTNTIAGTPQYIAPEVLRGEPYSFSADWWSSGILLYEMLTGRVRIYPAYLSQIYRDKFYLLISRLPFIRRIVWNCIDMFFLEIFPSREASPREQVPFYIVYIATLTQKKRQYLLYSLSVI